MVHIFLGGVMAKNSDQIGKAAEREAADRFNRMFGTNFYRSQQHKGATDAPDLIDDNHPELCPEVKRDSSFSIKLHRAVDKAREEAGENHSAFVLHRVPDQRWLLTVDLLDAPELVLMLTSILADCQGILHESTTRRVLNYEFKNMVDDARRIKKEAESEGIDGKRKKRKGAKK